MVFQEFRLTEFSVVVGVNRSMFLFFCSIQIILVLLFDWAKLHADNGHSRGAYSQLSSIHFVR